MLTQQFLWINPNILKKDLSEKIRLSDGFHSLNTDLRYVQPIIDRTNTFNFYHSRFKFDTSNFVIPDIKHNSLQFDEICSLRCNYIINLAKEQSKKIILFYSGGVDSTALLSSFIQNFTMAELRDLVYIACDESSKIGRAHV